MCNEIRHFDANLFFVHGNLKPNSRNWHYFKRSTENMFTLLAAEVNASTEKWFKWFPNAGLNNLHIYRYTEVIYGYCISWLQRRSRLGLGKDKWFHPTIHWACDYLSMLGLKLIDVRKKAPKISMSQMPCKSIPEYKYKSDGRSDKWLC